MKKLLFLLLFIPLALGMTLLTSCSDDDYDIDCTCSTKKPCMGMCKKCNCYVTQGGINSGMLTY